jgi:hypothetical protein
MTHCLLRRTGLVGLVGLAALAGCNADRLFTSGPASSSAPVSIQSGGPVTSAGLRDDSPPAESSGYLLIPKARLAELQQKAKSNSPDFAAMKATADENLAKPDSNRGSAENTALTYLLTADKKYADSALAWAKKHMAEDVRDGSYLGYGDLMRSVALVLNWCSAALAPEAKKELADYLAKWSEELWFANKGSGWGLADPGNNYHMAFIEGSAYAGYALTAAGDARGKRFVDLVRDKMDRRGGVLEYLETRGKGGMWHEGTNYGQRSNERLFGALAAVASMGGPNWFKRSRFFGDAVRRVAYEVQPGNRYLAPSGDLARDAGMPVSPFDRDWVQLVAFWVDDPQVRGIAGWFLKEVMPSYADDKTFNWRGAYYRDVLFGIALPVESPGKLPLSYRAEGNGWVALRSGWDARATAVTVAGNAVLDQSHAHVDIGSFTIWKDGWQAPDAVSYGRSGLNWDAGSHNMIHVKGHARFDARTGGLQRFADDGSVAYLTIDGTGLFKHRPGSEAQPMLGEWTRELVYARPDTLVVYDRVQPLPVGRDYEWRMHFPARPTVAGNRATASNQGGAIAVTLFGAKAMSVAEDADLPEGGSRAFRIGAAPDGDPMQGRFLAAIQVASGAPPAATAERIRATGNVDGVAVGDVVAVFSKQPKGAAVPSFSYTVAGTGKRTHVLLDMAGGCNAEVKKSGDATTVTVSPGNKYPAKDGMVRITE